MKWIFVAAAFTAGGGAVAYKVAGSYLNVSPSRIGRAMTQGETLRAGAKIGPVDVGGMTVEDAERAVRTWWEDEKTHKLTVVTPGLAIHLPAMKPGELGVTIDDVNSVKGVLDGAGVSDAEPNTFPAILKWNGVSLKPLEARLGKAAGHPAKVRYEGGRLLRMPEVPGVQLDEAGLPAAVAKAVQGDHTVDLPVQAGTAKTTEAQLEAITDVVASYTTHFPTYRRTRCSNIKLAAHIIDGTVLMPGERFSFNDVVGRRTLKAGFKLAGVYINGQHDTGIGGGICQVSTTLYNAALLSDLAIHRRSNHSLPVPYVPLGRDATVDYGNLDLVFENTYPTPIAVSSEYHPGALTFRILGKKQAGLSVKIIRGPLTWVPEEVENVNDPSLPLGQHRVLKPGSAYRSVRTVRVVYMDGKEVKREPLGRSTYGGQPRVVAVGAKPVSPAEPIGNVPVTTAPAGRITGGG